MQGDIQRPDLEDWLTVHFEIAQFIKDPGELSLITSDTSQQTDV